MEVGQRDDHSRGTLSQINVTPFVDVMLVLLVIFMVTAPMMEQGLEVNLPEVQSDATLTQSQEPVTVTVLKDGTIAVGKSKLKSLEKIGPLLIQILKERRDAPVLLEADRAVPYGRVMEVMGAIQGAGITKVGMVTQPPRD